MAGKPVGPQHSLRRAQRKRTIPSGPRRVIHVTLPLELAKRLERLVVERDVANASVVVCDLVRACPIRAVGSPEPAAGGGDAG